MATFNWHSCFKTWNVFILIYMKYVTNLSIWCYYIEYIFIYFISLSLYLECLLFIHLKYIYIPLGFVVVPCNNYICFQSCLFKYPPFVYKWPNTRYFILSCVNIGYCRELTTRIERLEDYLFLYLVDNSSYVVWLLCSYQMQ